MPDLETRYHDPRDHRRKGREYPRGHRAVTQPQGVSLRCARCAGDGVAGHSTSAFWRTLRTLTQFGVLWAITWYTTLP